MAFTPTSEYLRTQVMTASPEALQLMLWDGAIRFAEQGKEAILRKDIEGSYKALVRSQRIITEMSASLRPEHSPDLCAKMAALYNFIYRRLVDANVQKKPELVNDALEIMRHQRETWAMLIEKMARERAQSAEPTIAENAAAIDAAGAPEVAAATAAAAPATPIPARRSIYPGLALKPASARTATLSVQG